MIFTKYYKVGKAENQRRKLNDLYQNLMGEGTIINNTLLSMAIC